MQAPSPSRGAHGGREVYWTRARVFAALARFVAEFGVARARRRVYMAIVSGTGPGPGARGPRRDFPSVATVARYAPSLAEALRMAGVELPARAPKRPKWAPGPRPCKSGCGRETEGRFAEYCEYCRPRGHGNPQKYWPTEEIDEALREIYQERAGRPSTGIPTVTELGKRIGWPKHALRVRARELGLTRTKEPNWTEAERAILSRYAHLGDSAIQLRLARAGFERTETAIHLEVRRTSVRKAHGIYSATSLARMLGIDGHAVTNWIRDGVLVAQKRGTRRTASQGGDSYGILQEDLYAFVLANPALVDLRKVDQRWFLNLITEGRVPL